MKRRLLAGLLTLCMLLSLLPTTVFAAEPGVVTATKRLVDQKPDKNGDYTIELSIQGNPVTTTTPSKADVVLIIDNSGSMASSVGRPCGTPKEDFNDDLTVFGKGIYQCETCGAFYYNGIFWSNLPDVCTGQVGKYPRIDTAKEVGTLFAQNILSGDNDNKMAVVGFSSDSTDGGADDTNALKVTQELTNQLDSVTSAINRMKADGGTNYSAALQQAHQWLSNRADQTRPAYVIFISDGAPGLSGDSIGDLAWNGYNQAVRLKDQDNVSLYTIGIALGNSESQYLQSLASDPEHYINVTGEEYKEQLKNVLTQWAEEINTVPAGTNAVMTDVISDDFTLVSGSQSSDLTVGADGKTLTWNIGSIPTSTEKVTFKIHPKDKLYGEDIPTNESVTLTYIDSNNAPQEMGESEIGHPTVDIAATVFDVTYNRGANGHLEDEDSNGNVVHEDCLIGSDTPAAPAVTPDEGWYFTGWSPEISEKVTGEAVYTAQYAEKTEITIKATDTSKVYDGTTQTSDAFTTTLPDGYTVTGVTVSGGGKDVKDGGYPLTVDASSIQIKDAQGNDVTNHYTVVTESGTLTITKRPSPLPPAAVPRSTTAAR